MVGCKSAAAIAIITVLAVTDIFTATIVVITATVDCMLVATIAITAITGYKFAAITGYKFAATIAITALVVDYKSAAKFVAKQVVVD